MYGVRHHITEEFPEFSNNIEVLKRRDKRFARLLDKYDETDKQICGYEQRRQAVADSYIEQLKKWRLQLKDQLYATLRQQRHNPSQATS